MKEDDEIHKEDQPDRGSAADGAAPATRDPLQQAAERLLTALDPRAPETESIRQLVKDTLDRLAQSEDRHQRDERRIEWLESRNVCDEITGLLNRRGFADGLHRCLARARRYDETSALLLVDLPRQEGLVDDHGSDAGDYMLTAVANILLRQFREVDYVARLDNGRFAVLLVQIDEEDARRRATMLEGQLAEIAVPWDGGDIPIDARVGLFPLAQTEAPEELLERAEAELEARELRAARLRNTAE